MDNAGDIADNVINQRREDIVDFKKICLRPCEFVDHLHNCHPYQTLVCIYISGQSLRTIFPPKLFRVQLPNDSRERNPYPFTPDADGTTGKHVAVLGRNQEEATPLAFVSSLFVRDLFWTCRVPDASRHDYLARLFVNVLLHLPLSLPLFRHGTYAPV